jgi:probable F420-dependent oxidoreductase
MHGLAVGLQLARVPFAEAVALARAAEDAGFTKLTVGDNMTEGFTMVGALGAMTRTAQIHTSIVTWTRTPVLMALAATTAATLTGGRFGLGLGTMPRAWSEDYHGIPYANPVGRMRDYVGAIRAALSATPDAPVDYEGPFYRMRGYRPLLQPSEQRIPITLGVIRPRMSRLAGEIADGVCLDSMNSVEWTRDVLWPQLSAGLAASGRPRSAFEAGTAVISAIADDPREARDMARRTIAFYLITPYLKDVMTHHGCADAYDRGLAALERGDREAAARAIPDEIVEAIAVTGTPDEYREKLRRYVGVVDWVRLSPAHANPLPVVIDQARRIVAAVATA